MDFDDVGATLKELDELDAQVFGGSSRQSKSNATGSKAPFSKVPETEKDDLDFDDDSDDLADLLNDDDDVFSKKYISKSPIKAKNESTFSPKKSVSDSKQNEIFQSKKSNFEFKNTEKENSPLKIPSSKDFHKQALVENASKGEITGFDDSVDALEGFKSGQGIKNSTFLVSAEKSSPIQKGRDKGNGFLTNETNFLEDLGLNQLSLAASSKNRTDDSLMKDKDLGKEVEISSDDDDDDDDILKTLGLDIEEDKKPSQFPRKNSGHLNTLSEKKSPQHINKNLVCDGKKESIKNNDIEDEDIFGSYVPTASSKGGVFSPKKSDIQDSKISDASRKKRGSLLKQVSFQNIPESSEPEKMSKTEEPLLVKETASTKQLVPELKKSEKVDKGKEKEMDWLSFFKESPKKGNKTVIPEVSKKPESKIQISKDTVSKKDAMSNHGTRRRSSNSEWLGIDESKSAANKKDSNDKIEGKTLDWLVSGDSHAAEMYKTSESTRPRARRSPAGQTKDNWLGGGDKDNDQNLHELDMNKTSKLVSNSEVKEKVETRITTPKHKFSHETDAFNVNNRMLQSEIIPVQYQKDTLDASLPSPIISNIQEVSGQNSVVEERYPTERVISQVIPTTSVNFAPVSNMPLQQNTYAEVNQTAFASLQLMLNNSTQEKEQLMKTSEGMKLMYEEKIASLENSLKAQLKISEDLLETQTKKLKEEYGSKLQTLEQQLNQLESEKIHSQATFQFKLDALEKEQQKEVHRLKELHSESISAMRQDHEDALSRLKKLKDQEVEAISSTQVYTRSLQHLTDQLEARAAELALLQSKVDERNQTATREKQALLDNKEKDLKALQNRLQRQLDDGDEERTRLQQLVLRLESRLQKYTMEGEEDRWEVQQMKARLTVQQKYLDEEHKLHLQQIEREKEKLRLSQDSLLHEQKTVLLQLAQERQQLIQEKIDMESLSKRVREEDSRLNMKKLKEESILEAQRRKMMQQEDKLHLERSQVKQEAYQFEREQESVEREKQHLKEEKEKFNEFRLTIKKRTEEVEEIAMSAAAEREQGRSAHAAARKIEAEHHTRIQHLTQQMQILMDKERQILLEKEKLVEEKRELESKKDSMLCHRCKLTVGLPVNSLPPGVNNPQQLQLPVMNGVTNTTFHPHVDPSLVVWYITAQKDREFLQEELSFLHSLKDSGKLRKDFE